ncbi:MAG: LamG domain-containing protein, partial [Duncaniella sp.]|nr:LamG domain-containing protein [Duncaniella sp.]
AVKTGAIADNNEPLLLGISDEAARPYDGVMDEFVIYPRALTADEVKADYNVLAESNLQEVIATSENSVYTVVDAFSGMRIRTAAGSAAATITNGLTHGVYVLVIETPGAEMETYKFVK